MSIAVLATCTAQAIRPRLVDAMLRTGHRLGLTLEAPGVQTCCGLPAWEAGHIEAARTAARHTLSVFATFATVVTPSPACLRMVKQHIPSLLAGTPEEAAAQSLAARSQTWCSYLIQRIPAERFGLRFEGTVAFFRSCTEADMAPALLLGRCQGTQIAPAAVGRCCGWGGNMALRHPEVSRSIAAAVVTELIVGRADVVVTTDVGCLIHLERFVKEAGGPPILHIAEFIALASAESR